MAKANKTKYALLGVLRYSSGSGYDIKKFCDQSIGYFWNENYGHIYPVLKKLEEEKLITKQIEETEGRPAKNIYSITEEGKNELNEWLLQPPDKVLQRSEILLKLFFSKDVPTNDIIQKLKDEKSELQNRLHILTKIEKSLTTKEFTENNSKKKLTLWTITLKFGIKNTKAAIEWCDESVKLLKLL